MNRDFIVSDLTPAKARMMVMASRVANLHISREIIDRSQEDLLDIDASPVVTAVCQFIVDYQHRCVIPYDGCADTAKTAIALMLPKDEPVLFLTDDASYWGTRLDEPVTAFSERNTNRLQYVAVKDLRPSEMVRVRDRYTVAEITPLHVGFDWLGKLFPRLVIHCQMNRQYNLPLGGLVTPHHSAARHAAAILYPAVVNALHGDNNLGTRGDAILPMMGCHNGLLVAAKKNKHK